MNGEELADVELFTIEDEVTIAVTVDDFVVTCGRCGSTWHFHNEDGMEYFAARHTASHQTEAA